MHGILNILCKLHDAYLIKCNLNMLNRLWNGYLKGFWVNKAGSQEHRSCKCEVAVSNGEFLISIY